MENRVDNRVDNVIDEEFARNFEEFYLELTLLNYKYRTQKIFTEKDLKSIGYFKLLIPIFKRLQDEGDTLNLNKVLQEEDNPPISYTPIIKIPTESSNKYELDNNISEPEEIEEEDTSEDEEGDTQLNNLTEDVLTLLSTKIQKNNWVVIEPEENMITEEYIEETHTDACPLLVDAA
jgi:hypothetical protein